MNSISNKTKILFCSSFTPPLHAGGGKNVFNLARFLSDKGYSVTLLSLNRRGKLPSKSRSGDLVIRRILYFNQNTITKLLSLFIILPNYFYYVSKHDAIFIYGGNIIGYEFIILCGRFLRKKVVFRSTMLEEDDILTIIEKNSVLKPVRKWILSLMDVYFSINTEFTKSYVAVFGDDGKIMQSAQGVDTRFFFPVTQEQKKMIRRKLGLPEDLFLIITVGFLVRRKGYRELFEVLGNLDIPFLYIVVGDYEVDKSHYLYHIRKEMKSLYDMGNNLLKEKILFTGPIENVNEYMQASNVFLLNSKREGVPNALLEAMACGTGCIVRNLKGVDQYITVHHENSMVYSDPKDIISLIDYLRTHRNNCKELAENSVRTILENFSFTKIYDLLVKNRILTE